MKVSFEVVDLDYTTPCRKCGNYGVSFPVSYDRVPLENPGLIDRLFFSCFASENIVRHTDKALCVMCKYETR